MKNLHMSIFGIMLLTLACSKDKEEQTDTVVTTETNTPVISTDYFLNVYVTNIKDLEGNINYVVYDSQEDFENESNWVLASKTSVNNDTIKIQIKNLSTGDYVVSLYHDKNSNDELDKNLIGIPTEGFGFSNNAMGTFGPPTFDQAKIHVDSLINQSIFISLRFF